MSHIKIVQMSDYNDCEQCGGGSEYGGYVEIDGKRVFEHIPVASCYGNEDIGLEELVTKALEAMNCTVEFSWQETDETIEFIEDDEDGL